MMKYKTIHNTNLKVSTICLGTMTYGEQNSQDEAHAQLDFATANGVNFIDTAEMYPVPPMSETYTRTETIIGNWHGLHQNRDKIILATKIAGPATYMPYVREGKNRFDRANIHKACHDSLKRLKTDYIDIYQLHWPNRTTNTFGMRYFDHNKNEDQDLILESIESLNQLIKEGKIRHYGLSNETSWGAMKFLALCDKHNMQRPVTIQNPYNLLNRSYEVNLAEVSIREKIGLLAYSPLAFGTLSGKYLDGKRPEGARITRWARFSRYNSEMAQIAIAKYVTLAKDYKIDPTQMALAFVNSREFLCANIIGASNLEQLKSNIDSINLELPNEVITEINNINAIIPDPCP